MSEYRCRICGRRLKVALSVKRGVGPVCWARRQRNHVLEDYEEPEWNQEVELEAKG